MVELQITAKEAGQRFDKFLKKYLNEAPGSFIYKMLRKKNITLNGKKAAGSELLADGDQIRLFLSDETIRKFHQSRTSAAPVSVKTAPSLSVIYEDDDLIFINKPANMLTQKGNDPQNSLTEFLLQDLLTRKMLTEEDLRAFRPSPANRLDRNTTGLVLCSKSLRGAQFLSEMIRNRDLKKEYQVLVSGRVNQNGVKTVYYSKDAKHNLVTLYPDQKEGRGFMKTGIYPVQVSDQASLLRIDLLTGKTHQIRAHLAYLGHPVLGDSKYGDPKQNRMLRQKHGIRRQMLHAWRITFPEVSGSFSYLSGKSFTAPPPEDFCRAASLYHLSCNKEKED